MRECWKDEGDSIRRIRVDGKDSNSWGKSTKEIIKANWFDDIIGSCFHTIRDKVLIEQADSFQTDRKQSNLYRYYVCRLAQVSSR